MKVIFKTRKKYLNKEYTEYLEKLHRVNRVASSEALYKQRVNNIFNDVTPEEIEFYETSRIIESKKSFAELMKFLTGQSNLQKEKNEQDWLTFGSCRPTVG